MIPGARPGREVPHGPRPCVHGGGRSMPRLLHVVPGASASVEGFEARPDQRTGTFAGVEVFIVAAP